MNIKAEAQRVYANIYQTGGTPLLASVQNPDFATDGDYNNRSTLLTPLGLLNLVEAWQNLQFTGANKPTVNSSLYVKIGVNGTFSGQAGNIELSRTNGGSANLVTPTYSGNGLLTLIGTGGNTAEVTITPTGQVYDGVRYKVSSTLGLLVTGYYYYAFFIVAPTAPNQTVCYGYNTAITVINNQSGFYYKWYDAATGGNLLQNSQSAVYITPAITTNKDYFVEAVDSTVTKGYVSARTKITITVQPTPHPPPPLTSFQ